MRVDKTGKKFFKMSIVNLVNIHDIHHALHCKLDLILDLNKRTSQNIQKSILKNRYYKSSIYHKYLVEIWFIKKWIQKLKRYPDFKCCVFSISSLH